VIGELALGQMQRRDVVLASPAALPQAAVASDTEALGFIERRALQGRGIRLWRRTPPCCDATDSERKVLDARQAPWRDRPQTRLGGPAPFDISASA
jgi:hypothetical protein